MFKIFGTVLLFLCLQFLVVVKFSKNLEIIFYVIYNILFKTFLKVFI